MALGFQAYTNTGDRGFCTSGKGTTFSRAVQSVSPWSGTAGSRALPRRASHKGFETLPTGNASLIQPSIASLISLNLPSKK